VRADSFISRTKENAEKIESDSSAAKAEAERQMTAAKAAMTAAKAAMTAALSAQDQAIKDQRKAKGILAHARREAARVQNAAARLQRIPSILRTLWDGFRESQVKDRIHKSVETEMNDLRSRASRAVERATEANQARRRAEERAMTLDRAITEIGVERDDARRELSRLRPSDPEIGISVEPGSQPFGSQ
jgi:chromosome segregation ATPase